MAAIAEPLACPHQRRGACLWCRAADQVDPQPHPYANDPAGWVKATTGEHLWSKQVEILEALRDHRRVAVKAAHGPGKALALDEPLVTPTGWTTMGGVQVGDQLVDEQGKPCRVVCKSDVRSLPASRVVFSDGSTIVASDDHLWNAVDIAHRPRGVADWRDHWAATSTVTTAAMRASLRSNGNQPRWRVPTAHPLAVSEPWTLSYDPYTFGAWLGDGTTVRAELTCHVDDAPHFAAQTGGGLVKLASTRPNARQVMLSTTPYASCPGRESGGKRIPARLLRSSVEARLALLQGLMDTDGNLTDGAGVEIALCSEALIDDVHELILSLGWVVRRSSRPAKINGRAVGVSHRLVFRPLVNPFRLPRKADEWARRAATASQRSRHTQRTIVAIEAVGTVPVQCVTVDSPRSLYLAGRSMIPTHNSFTGARAVGWWEDTHPDLESFAVTSAPTDPQVKAILWREITRVHRKGQLQGRVTQDAQWKVQDELVAYGRKPADHDEHGFQGIHARYVLVVLDEACGIPMALWTATDTLVTNEDSRILAIGNPDDPTSQFAAICEGAPEDGSSGMSKAGWWVITISVFDTPNFTGEPVPSELRHYLPSATWVEERRRAWGEGSPLWTSKVLGRFPDDASDGVVPWSALKRCQSDEVAAALADARDPVRLGVDVGGSELGDETVIQAMAGRKALGGEGHDDHTQRGVRRLSTGDSEEIVDAVIEMVIDLHAVSVTVDAIGVGFGVVGSLRRRVAAEVPWPVVVHGENVGEAAKDRKRFLNRRAELWWTIGREWTQDGAWDLSDVDDDTLLELAEPKYREVNGRVQIESKDDIRKRREGRSTDSADALLLAAILPPSPATGKSPAGRRTARGSELARRQGGRLTR